MDGARLGRSGRVGTPAGSEKDVRLLVPDHTVAPVLDPNLQGPMLGKWSEGYVLVLPCAICLKVRRDGCIVSVGTTSEYGQIPCTHAAVDEVATGLDHERTRIGELYGQFAKLQLELKGVLEEVSKLREEGDTLCRFVARSAGVDKGVGGVAVHTLGTSQDCPNP